MTNREIAHVLFNIATLLELAEGNPYRIRAYRRAARSMLRLPREISDPGITAENLPVDGLGKRLRTKISQLASQGRMAFYEELVAEQHPAVQALMRVPGVGPKTALRLFTELHLTTPEHLLFAAQRGRVRELWGFGARRERALEEGAASVVASDELARMTAADGSQQLPLVLSIPGEPQAA